MSVSFIRDSQRKIISSFDEGIEPFPDDASIQEVASSILRKKGSVLEGAPPQATTPKRTYVNIATIRNMGIPVRHTPFAQLSLAEGLDPDWGGSCHVLSYEWMDRKMRSRDFQEQTAYEITDSHLPHPVVMGNNTYEAEDIQQVRDRLLKSGYQHQQIMKENLENEMPEKGIDALINYLGRYDTHGTLFSFWWFQSKTGFADNPTGHACAFVKRGDECSWYDPNFGEMTFERFEHFALWFRMEVMDGNQACLLQEAMVKKWETKGQLFKTDLASPIEFSDSERNTSILSQTLVDRRHLSNEMARSLKINPMFVYELNTFILNDPSLAVARHIPKGYEDMLSEEQEAALYICPVLQEVSPDLQEEIRNKLNSKRTLNLEEITNTRIRLGLNSPEEVLKLCPNLESLDLSNYKELTDDQLDNFLKICPNLIHIKLENCDKITGMGLRHISPNLLHLDLSGCCSIKDMGLEFISKCSNLTHLNISGCQITNLVLGRISLCSKLTFLHLGGCTGINDIGLEYISRCAELKFLSLKGCFRITDCGLKYISRCSQVVHLNLENCYRLTDRGIEYILHPGLIHLDLTKCQNLTDHVLHRIGLTCPNLTTLKLSNCKITDMGLMDFSIRCRHLQHLHIPNCKHVTDAGIEFALLEIPTLTLLACKGCSYHPQSPKPSLKTRIKYIMSRHGSRCRMN